MLVFSKKKFFEDMAIEHSATARLWVNESDGKEVKDGKIVGTNYRCDFKEWCIEVPDEQSGGTRP